MDKLKTLLRAFDMFSYLPVLRAKSQPQTSNSCGGLLSIAILIFFAYLFISQFYQVLTYQQIKAITNTINNRDSSKAVTDFMAGVGVQGFNLTQIYPFMRFQFLQITLKGTNFISSRILEKQPCQISHLSQLGGNAQKSYNDMNMKDKYCLVPGQNITINQVSSDGVYRLLSVTVNSCLKIDYNGTNVYEDCASQEQFNFGNLVWISLNKYFTTNVVFLSTGFKPNEKVPTTKFADFIRSTFTMQRASETLVFLSTYKVTTDTNIMPFPVEQTEEGYTFDKIQSSDFEAVPFFQNVNVYFVLSDNQINISRTLGKIDEILSYVGGLFGIMLSFIAFFVISFNQYRYELLVAEGAFNYSQDGSKIKQHDFHFLQYVKYSCYEWIKTFTCLQPSWKNCKQISQTRQQANKQLNVTLLFKKIQHFQKVIQYLISQKQNISIYLTEPPSIQQARRTRIIAQYYQKIINGKAATTVEDIQNVSDILHQMLDQNLVNNGSRSELVIKGSNSKRKLYDQPGQQRQNILQKILQQFKQQFDTENEDIQLSQQQIKVEQEIAESFFRMEQKARSKIQQKIPLKILYRLKRRYENTLSKQSISINLQI